MPGRTCIDKLFCEILCFCITIFNVNIVAYIYAGRQAGDILTHLIVLCLVNIVAKRATDRFLIKMIDACFISILLLQFSYNDKVSTRKNRSSKVIFFPCNFVFHLTSFSQQIHHVIIVKKKTN